MTALEIYGLLAPFPLVAAGALLALWARHQAAKPDAPARSAKAHPAE